MQHFGNIDMDGVSYITNVLLENINSDPSFEVSQAGRVYFNPSTSTMRLNNGTEYISVTLPADVTNMITTLGSSWINANFGFNPSAFDEFSNVTDLTSNSSLFDVLLQLDTAITETNIVNLTDLEDVVISTALAPGNVLYYDGAHYTFSDIATIISTYDGLRLENLKDVVTTNLANGGILIWDTATETFNAGNITQTIQDFAPVANHTITHNLNVQFCQVTIINMTNNSLVQNATVVFTAVNTINIALPTAFPITVVLAAVPVTI